MAEQFRNRSGRSGVQVKTENKKFPVVCSRSPQNLEFGHFVLLLEQTELLSIVNKMSSICECEKRKKKKPEKKRKCLLGLYNPSLSKNAHLLPAEIVIMSEM